MPCRWMLCLLLVSPYATSQSSSTTDDTAMRSLRTSFTSLTHSVPLSDVTVSGTVRRSAGGEKESGQIVAEALASGQSRIDYDYSSGKRSESRTIGARNTAVEKWSGMDGAEHNVVAHNVAPLSPWFSPALLVQTIIHSSNIGVTTLGTEIHSGQSLVHLVISKQIAPLHHPPMMLDLLRKANRVDLYIDSTTGLPTTLKYNAHPDTNLAQDIPVEIRFEDYQTVNDAQVPFQIKKYFNRTLELEINVTSATLNSGLSPSSLKLQ